MTEGTGLRARKKARTRANIASTAARLFGEYGYERVSVADVAGAAEVSEQTVYNYFPTKRDLVLDRDDELRRRLADRIRRRASGTSPAAAIRADAESLVDAIGSMPVEELQGSVGHLAATSAAVRRLCLESTDQLANDFATAIVDTTTDVSLARAKVHAIALAWISQTVIDEGGRRSRDGQRPDQIVREVRPLVSAIVDALDTWFHHEFAP